jgi:hypothetical protein
MAEPFLSPLPQAKQREDEQNHDDQADKINQTIHGALPKLPLSPCDPKKNHPQARKFRRAAFVGRPGVKASGS